MQIVPDLVYRLLLRLLELARPGKGVFFKEEADLVAGGQEVVVADVVGVVGGESREGVSCEVEVCEESAGLGEEGGDLLGGEGVGDYEVAVGVEGGDLRRGEAGCRGRWCCGDRSHGV